MAYSEEFISPAVVPTSAPSSAQSLASVADMLVFNIGESLKLTRIMVEVSTAVVSTAPAVVTVYQRPTYGSTAGQIAIGTLSIPGGTAAGKILYKNVESVKLVPGQQLAFACTTAATSSGAGLSMFKGFIVSEVPSNVANMIASA